VLPAPTLWTGTTGKFVPNVSALAVSAKPHIPIVRPTPILLFRFSTPLSFVVTMIAIGGRIVPCHAL